MKKYSIYLFCLIFLLTQSGCLTSNLYGYRSAYRGEALGKIFTKEKIYTNDTISAFLLDEKIEKLIFIGEKYHYTFDFNKEKLNNNIKTLFSFLTWEKNKYLELDFSTFAIEDNNKVYGDFSIEISEENQKLLTKKDLIFLEKLGLKFYFAPDGTLREGNDSNLGYGKRLVSSLGISGIRGLPKERNLQSKIQLPKPYIIEFSEIPEVTTEQMLLGALLTPITVVIDLLILVLAIPAALIAAPVFILSGGKH